jgi:phosphate-selective porin OprO/OprP
VPEFGENKTSGYNPASTTKSSSNSGIVDAYVDARFKPWFQVRAGKFKPYVGLERLQSGADTKFIERSYVSNNILPNRDLGVSAHGDLFADKLTYAVGVFNGVVDGGDNVTTQDLNGDKDFAARVFTTPFKGEDSVLAGLGFGLAATHTNTNGISNYSTTTGLPDYKTPGQQSSFFTYSSGTVAQGVRNRWAPQAYYYYGPFGVLAEYAQVDQHVYNSGATAGYKAGSLSNDAWHLTASWLLTGEDASFKGVKPKNAFNPDGAGWGAWEIVARYQENNIDDATFNTASTNKFADPRTASKSAESWALGVNWYLNQNIKIATDYEQTSFKWGGGGTLAAPIDRADEKTLFTRLQVSY